MHRRAQTAAHVVPSGEVSRGAINNRLTQGRRLATDNLIWMILAVTFAIGSTFKGFLSTTNLLNVLWASVPMGCMVLGMFFVMLTGGLDLSLESIYGVAPVVGVVVLAHLKWLPGPSAILICLAMGAFAGLMNGLITVRLRVNPFLVTLAALLFWRGLVIYLIPEGLYTLPNGFDQLGGLRLFSDTLPVAIIVAAIMFVIAYVVVNRTSFGKAIYAVGSNQMAAYVAGINVARVRLAVFVIAGFLAGLGGLIEVGRIGAVVSDLGQGSIIIVFAGTILGGTSLLGGRGRVSGIIAAVIELALIDNVMNLIGVDPAKRQMIFAVVLLVAIYIASLQDRRETVNA